jgi:hypothetical protein
MELWIDYVKVGQEIVLDYVGSHIGFGAGLNEFEEGTTFTTAFDDLADWTLKD